MAHSKSALKRWRQNERHRERNKPVRTAARTVVKNARVAIEGGSAEAADALRAAASVLDRAAKHNVIHRNAASRHKSRLMKALNRQSSVSSEEARPKRARKTVAKKAAKKAPAKRAVKKSAS
jgi:small subunit ribosomal protein S20